MLDLLDSLRVDEPSDDDYAPLFGLNATCPRCHALTRPGHHDCAAFLRERCRRVATRNPVDEYLREVAARDAGIAVRPT